MKTLAAAMLTALLLFGVASLALAEDGCGGKAKTTKTMADTTTDDAKKGS